MRTNEITQLGIDRNFLRQCEKQKLITPAKRKSEWIIHEEYAPKDYSQEDLEIVWNAYICRKMGLSYSEIRKITSGENVDIRDSFANLIKKYEAQIEELKAITDFMKFVKGIGFVPSMPNTLFESQSFKQYLTNYMEHLDNDKKIRKMIAIADCISEIDDFEEIADEKINNIEALSQSIEDDMDPSLVEVPASIFEGLQNCLDLEPSSSDTQTQIQRFFEWQKKLPGNENLSAWDFAAGHILILSHESDVSVMYKNLLGEDTCNYFLRALLAFIKVENPETVKALLTK